MESSEIHPEAIKTLSDHRHTVITAPSKEELREADIVFVRTYTRVDRQFLDSCPKLRYILRAGVGLDAIDLAECRKRNIEVINAPGSNANAVAEYIVGVIIMFMRNLREQSITIERGGWRDRALKGTELTGKTLGLIGCGAIGREVARKMQPFELGGIIGYDPYLDTELLLHHTIQKTDLITLIRGSDIISLHLPLTDETRHMISKEQFALMKSTALLINTSRGGLIDETALLETLDQNTLAGAVLDVFETEPHVNTQLIGRTNVILTPHIAGYTKEADIEMSMLPVTTLLKKLKNSSDMLY